MLIRNLELRAANLTEVHIKDIKEDVARKFIGELRTAPRQTIVDVYSCSDGRNKGVRQILNHLPFVRVLNTAGNVVFCSNAKPSVVIAHGDSDYLGCGAVGYAKDNPDDKDSDYSPIFKIVKGHPIDNAREQLNKIPKEYRAGIIYFNHVTCEVEMIATDKESGKPYSKASYCVQLFDELKVCLKHRYTEEEKAMMAKGQNPDIILLTNLFTQLTAFDLFRIDLQRNTFHGIISASLAYVMNHALKGSGSFRDTKTAFMVFRKGDELPRELGDFLDKAKFIHDYIKRGGSVYLVTVGDLPSGKTILRMDIK